MVMNELQVLVGFTYWWPENGIDSPESVGVFSDKRRTQYLKEL